MEPSAHQPALFLIQAGIGTVEGVGVAIVEVT
ncbi:MAG: hypothetical protein MAG458_00215 [Nitrosopumilus sp.]|nr:hypothetical protein [Nitrosopumilus sp.]